MERPLVVLQSVPPPRPTTNPYIVMLVQSLNAVPGVSILHFSWRTALLGRYDVFHVHWPEILVGGRTTVRRLAHQALLGVLLLRLRLSRTVVVRTVHNIDLPTGLTWGQRRLLRALDDQVIGRIRLNDETELLDIGDWSDTVVTVPHGHFRSWYGARARAQVEPGRIAFVGLVRRYKGVDELLRAFTATRSEHPELRLQISGAATSPELAAELTSLAANDARVTLTLQFLDDDQLVGELTAAELVVLPARLMHNSSSVLAALSMDRPVLVVDNEVNRALAAEVGPGWVLLYRGELAASHLIEAIEDVRAGRRTARPDLSGRDWAGTGIAHLAAYRAAVARSSRR